MMNFDLPTGKLLVRTYEKGELETLSIGDYGKSRNVKADFLGYTRPIHGVPNGEIMPLSEKWVITLSTQYGCPMRCVFCDVPNITFKGNASFNDLMSQLFVAIEAQPDIRYTERLNIHFARMGEPIFNQDVFTFAQWLASSGKAELQKKYNLRIEVIHPVLTSSCPKLFKRLKDKLEAWCFIKNDMFRGQAGLQLSINSTNEHQRSEMFGNMQLSLVEIAEIAKSLPEPLGRKYCLNFAYATGYEIDAKRLRELFNPEHWMVKITPIHNNNACRENGVETVGGYNSFEPYSQVEADLKAAGFDVLVFVPSMDEEVGLITCGNAVLGGSESSLVSLKL